VKDDDARVEFGGAGKRHRVEGRRAKRRSGGEYKRGMTKTHRFGGVVLPMDEPRNISVSRNDIDPHLTMPHLIGVGQ
jgi:hypothetical protein